MSAPLTEMKHREELLIPGGKTCCKLKVKLEYDGILL